MEGEDITEDNNNIPQVINRSRTYDCEICKRGFTNAQALGGHMNIHRNLNLNRKERSKSKNNTLISSSSSSSANFSLSQNPNFTLSSSYLPIQMNSREAPMNPEYIGHRVREGLDLSLRLGSINVFDENQRRGLEIEASQTQEDDLDLELRLGHRR